MQQTNIIKILQALRNLRAYFKNINQRVYWQIQRNQLNKESRFSRKSMIQNQQSTLILNLQNDANKLSKILGKEEFTNRVNQYIPNSKNIVINKETKSCETNSNKRGDVQELYRKDLDKLMHTLLDSPPFWSNKNFIRQQRRQSCLSSIQNQPSISSVQLEGNSELKKAGILQRNRYMDTSENTKHASTEQKSQKIIENEKNLTPNTKCSGNEPQNAEIDINQNIQVAQFQQKNKNKFKPTSIEETSTKPKDNITEPKHGLYYKNRSQLVEWLRVECAKLQLTRQTCSNALHLMDSYFKNSKFDSGQFLRIALCMMVVASKMNEYRILYTMRMAQNNRIDVQNMMETERHLLKWFNYRMDPYNYARIVIQYMKRWDELILNKKLQEFPLFFQQSQASYLLYQQLFYLCHQQIKNNRELLVQTIKIIFQELLASKIKQSSVSQLIQLVFQEENTFASEEAKYVFEWTRNEEYPDIVRDQLQQWMKDFLQQEDKLRNKYDSYKDNFKTYNIFINIQM